MIDAYEIGIRLALENGVSEGLAVIRRDLSALDAAIAHSAAGLTALQQLAAGVLTPGLPAAKPPTPPPARPPAPNVPPAEPAPRPAPVKTEPSTAPVRAESEGVPIRFEAPVRPSASYGPAQPEIPAAPVPRPMSRAQPAEPAPSRPVVPRVELTASPVSAPPVQPATIVPAAPLKAATAAPAPTRLMTSPAESVSRSPLTSPPSKRSAPSLPPATNTLRTIVPPPSPATGRLPRTRELVQTAQTPAAASFPAIAPALNAPPGRLAPTAPPPTVRPSAPQPSNPPTPPILRFAAQPPALAMAPRQPSLPGAPARRTEQDRFTTPQRNTPASRDGGDIYLEGSVIGRWLADSLARAASRPASGSTGFDPRLSPVWPGPSIGG